MTVMVLAFKESTKYLRDENLKNQIFCQGKLQKLRKLAVSRILNFKKENIISEGIGFLIKKT